MACNCNKNTTSDKIFAALKSAGINFRSSTVTGIGLFVVPDPAKGILEWKVIEVDSLTYEECMKRGASCESLQWVPKGFLHRPVERP